MAAHAAGRHGAPPRASPIVDPLLRLAAFELVTLTRALARALALTLTRT